MACRFLAKQPTNTGLFGWANFANCMTGFHAAGGPGDEPYCYTGTTTDSGPPIGKAGTNTDKQWFAFDFEPYICNTDETNIFLAWGESDGAQYVFSLYKMAIGGHWVIDMRHWDGEAIGGSLGAYNMGADPGWQRLVWERDESSGAQKVYLDDAQVISFTDNTSPEPSMNNIYHRHGVTDEKWAFSLVVGLANFMWNNDEAVDADDEWTTALANGVEAGLQTAEGVDGSDHRYHAAYVVGVIGPDTDPDFDSLPTTDYSLAWVVADGDGAEDDFTGEPDNVDKWKNVDGFTVGDYNYATATAQKQIHTYGTFSPGEGEMVLALAANFIWWQDPPAAVWAGNYMIARRNGGALATSPVLVDDDNCEEAWFGVYTMPTCPAVGAAVTYYKSVAGTLTPAGILAFKTSMFPAGTLTPSGVLTRLTKTSLAGTLSFAGTLAVVAIYILSLGGTLSFQGALTAQILIVMALAGTLTFTGTLAIFAKKQVAGILTLSGILTRKVVTSVTGTLPLTGVLTTISTFFASLAGTLPFTGSSTRFTKKAISGILTLNGFLIAVIALTLSGTLSFVGVLRRTLPVYIVMTLTLVSGRLTNVVKGASLAITTLSGRMGVVRMVLSRVTKLFSGSTPVTKKKDTVDVEIVLLSGRASITKESKD